VPSETTRAGSPQRKPYLSGMTTIQPGSPYHWQPNGFVGWPFFMMAIMLLPASRTLEPVMVFVLAFATIAGIAYFLTRPSGRHRSLLALDKLQKAIPWFDAHPVTCRALPSDEQLDAQLEPHGYRRVTLDGADITSWTELCDALGAHTEALTIPKDARARCMTLMARISEESPRLVIVWRNAMASAAANPAMVAGFVASWSAHAPLLRAGVLVFVDLPGAAEVESHREAPRIERGDVGEAPDRSILEQAPDGAWWKPKPGELTDGTDRLAVGPRDFA